ncbi:MAG: hypothetical protein M1828_004359 [Chrysothrix sp. TS-e1954]|nr:MAG: hypothetical protein M1828_004359 [Chrysothrix sp. TS-e1954]
MAKGVTSSIKRAPAAAASENGAPDGDATATQQPARRSARQQSKEPSEPAITTAPAPSANKRGRKRKAAVQDDAVVQAVPMSTVQEEEVETKNNLPANFQGGQKDAKRLIKSKLNSSKRAAKQTAPEEVNDPSSVEQTGNQRGKKANQRSLLDPQPNATRVEPFESIDPALEDDDVRVAQQLTAANRQEEQELQQDQMTAPQASMSQPESTYPSIPQSSQQDSSAAQANVVLPGDPLDMTFPEPSAPPQASYESYMEVNRRAKAVTQYHKQDKVPQLRKAWEPAEIERFIQLIGECGPSYSTIKSTDLDTGSVLIQRSQGNLKDKARNMKFDYLKSRVELPEGFDKIVLDKKLRDKLEEMGIPYTQHQVRKVR